MNEFTPLQRRLMALRDERCGGNAAELARKIGKDATYVNRLFYPAGKAGAKGVGMEIMAACNKAFDLPPGYWDGISAYWPFTEELQEAVSALDKPGTVRVENLVRAHLGMETLYTNTDAQLVKRATTDAGHAALRQNGPTDSAVSSGLTVVQSEPRLPTPALDSEDARHSGSSKNEERHSNRPPARPGNPRNPR